MKRINYGRQNISTQDIREVLGVLKSDFLTQGPKIAEFEARLAFYCGVKYVVAVSSGTAALHLASLALGLKKKDEVITSPITFLATSNCAIYTGARPVFADVDAANINIDPAHIEKVITKNTKAIIPVHFAGLPCDMQKISKIARKKGLFIIEDASHALGAQYKSNGRWVKIGSCKHSDMTVFSFHPVKSITTGEGGAITTNNKALYTKLLALRTHGVYKDKAMLKEHGPWHYEMRELGYNYRITDIQAVLGISQLKKLNLFIKIRESIAKRYEKAFSSTEDLITIPKIRYADKRSAWHLYVVRLSDKRLIADKKKLFLRMQKKGIYLQVHYRPVYKQPYYRKNITGKISLKNSESYYEQAISLPIYPALNNKQQDYIISSFKTVLKELKR